MRVALALLLCAATGEVFAQGASVDVGVHLGPIVHIAEDGEDNVDYEVSGVSGLAGIRLRTVSRRSAYVEIGYTVSNVTASRMETNPEVPDTLDVNMLDFTVGYQAEKGPVRFAPGIGFGVYRLKSPERGFFTTSMRLEFSPSPRAAVRPWFGVEAKYYGLRPFVDDGLYVVSATASVDFAPLLGR